MNILVTGGAGYIGSHICVALINEGYSVIVADNLHNSQIETIDKITEITNQEIIFYEVDVTDTKALEKVFIDNKIDGAIHCAGYKAVGESVEQPISYYSNNIISTLTLAELCLKYDVNRLVFSSSATVYGDNVSPFKESMNLLPTTNPYGETKAMSERILRDTAKANPEFGVSLLRYFNPVGAHKSGLIGENPSGIPNNLMPYITRVAKGELKKLQIFGNDYPTLDGTGVRDYIHVMDLAEGHVVALKNLAEGVQIYNLGAGKGTSVLELVTKFEEINNVKIDYEIVERREGDLAAYHADVLKANQELNWQTTRSISDMCQDAWRYEQKTLTK